MALKRYATPLALLAALVTFVLMFLLLDGATDAIRLAGPAALALLAALGTRLVLHRSPAEITDDAYHDDARGQVEACLDLVGQIRRDAKQLRSPSMHAEVDRMAQVVPELLRRVERTSPTSLYSSASQLRGHLGSLQGVVTTFADIEQHPAFYEDPGSQLVDGERAMRRFVEFSLESVRLVNQGDLAQYKANLATVAPPQLPRLTIPGPTPTPNPSAEEQR